MSSFVPGPETARDLRKALGCFPTGVTIVTTDAEIGPLGITANSFASVSLDPPLVLWSPARASRRFDAFTGAEHFAVHVIGARQQTLAERFSTIGHDFSGFDWSLNEHKVPLIEGCPARFECRMHARHDGGDHMILVAEVLRVTLAHDDPLLFSHGIYRGL